MTWNSSLSPALHLSIACRSRLIFSASSICESRACGRLSHPKIRSSPTITRSHQKSFPRRNIRSKHCHSELDSESSRMTDSVHVRSARRYDGFFSMREKVRLRGLWFRLPEHTTCARFSLTPSHSLGVRGFSGSVRKFTRK